MKKTTFKLELTNPCHENVEGMQANEQGFFCAACQKNVIDFTNKTPYEITQIIAALPDRNNFCGRFFTDQLDETYTLYEGLPSATWKYAAGFAAAMLLAQNVQGQSIQKMPMEQTEGTQPTTKAPHTANELPQKRIKVKGILLDMATKKPLDKTIHQIVKITNDMEETVIVNAETGEFIIDIIPKNEPSVLIVRSHFIHYGLVSFPTNTTEKELNVGELYISATNPPPKPAQYQPPIHNYVVGAMIPRPIPKSAPKKRKNN